MEKNCTLLLIALDGFSYYTDQEKVQEVVGQR